MAFTYVYIIPIVAGVLVVVTGVIVAVILCRLRKSRREKRMLLKNAQGDDHQHQVAETPMDEKPKKKYKNKSRKPKADVNHNGHHKVPVESHHNVPMLAPIPPSAFFTEELTHVKKSPDVMITKTTEQDVYSPQNDVELNDDVSEDKPKPEFVARIELSPEDAPVVEDDSPGDASDDEADDRSEKSVQSSHL